MKIKCIWVFKEKIPNTGCQKLKAKERKNIQEMTENEVMDMIEQLLAQNETARVIFEKDN